MDLQVEIATGNGEFLIMSVIIHNKTLFELFLLLNIVHLKSTGKYH